MNYGLVLTNLGPFGDIRLLVDLAVEAERAGWDGVFLWDTVQIPDTAGLPSADPWVAISAMAARTDRIRIGLRILALPRHRPWLIAQQAVAVDHLSGGRMILGVGAGEPADVGFTAFGEEVDAKVRAARLDEGLDIIDGLWSGETFSYDGEHFRVDPVQLLPRPVQRPRIPIWVGSQWPRQRPIARAARWDGINPLVARPDIPYDMPTPEELRAMRDQIAAQRPDGSAPYDIVVEAPLFDASSDPAAGRLIAELDDAGATWLLEAVNPDDTVDAVRAGIAAGPPR